MVNFCWKSKLKSTFNCFEMRALNVTSEGVHQPLAKKLDVASKPTKV